MPQPPKEMLISATELPDLPDDNGSLSVGVIRFVAGCEYGSGKCTKVARINIRATDHSGCLKWNRVFCHEHAASVLDRAPALGYWIIDD